MSIIELAKQTIQNMQPYKPGKPIEELQRELNIEGPIIKLASNENPLGPSPLAVAAASQALNQVNFYPDGSGYLLKEKLAKKYAVDLNQITLGTGSDNLVNLIAQTFVKANDEVIICQYGFLAYLVATLGIEGQPILVNAKQWKTNLPAMLEAITPNTRVIYLANPNNPTGTWFTHAEFQQFIEQVPQHVIVVLDEAYHEYLADNPNYPNALSLLNSYENLCILRTFSKIYGLAGLRVGYAFSQAPLADLLNRVRLPFNVNSPALAAATAALDDIEHVKKSLQCNRQGMEYLETFLQEKNIEYIPSGANFITIDCKRNANEIYEALLRQGIIVRPLAANKMPQHLRISIGTSDQLQRLTTAITPLFN